MRHLKTGEAARLLNITATTLRAWESIWFSHADAIGGQSRMNLYAEVVALRGALRDCVSISSAVRVAREELVARDSSLVDALGGYDRGRPILRWRRHCRHARCSGASKKYSSRR